MSRLDTISERIKTRCKEQLSKEFEGFRKFLYGGWSGQYITVKDSKGESVNVDLRTVFSALESKYISAFIDQRYDKAVKEFLSKVDKLSEEMEELRQDFDNLPRSG